MNCFYDFRSTPFLFLDKYMYHHGKLVFHCNTIISWPLYRAWSSPIMSGFHGAFATGVACQQGTLTLPDTWFRPPIVGLACAPIVETRFLELAMSLLDFSPRIPLGTFSILLSTVQSLLAVNTEYLSSCMEPNTTLWICLLRWSVFFRDALSGNRIKGVYSQAIPLRRNVLLSMSFPGITYIMV